MSAVTVCQIIFNTKSHFPRKIRKLQVKQETLKIVSRESPLAMWQACHVRDVLCETHPGLSVEIIGVTTEADKRLDISLDVLGGKGAFVKELEQALINGEADIAVHSMKDVSIELPPGLEIAVVMQREDPRDVLVSGKYKDLKDLPPGAGVGTSSLRRKAQLLSVRPDLDVRDIRGNVGTRLRKLEEENLDALILAAAGLKRLGLEDRISSFFSAQQMLPAVSQGVLGIEVCESNIAVKELILPLMDNQAKHCVTAEREVNRCLGGDCHAPLAAYAEIDGSGMQLRAMVGALDGSEILRASAAADMADAAALGKEVGENLLSQGAAAILRRARGDDAT